MITERKNEFFEKGKSSDTFLQLMERMCEVFFSRIQVIITLLSLFLIDDKIWSGNWPSYRVVTKVSS